MGARSRTARSSGLYAGGVRNGYNPTGALPLVPPAGEWFPEAFRGLLANAYPPLP
ncbi:hypothetical protein AB0H83_31655 [Dactylosporangium sp. NPDC050688]|uniref:hypothetical protein n=1 Tax=Dactylosporangium sp. NPDC050688 TaxID=3157217 RepID=UPI0034003BDC